VARDPTEPDMPSFEDLGLRPELLRALEDQELDQPTALQEAVIPALRRGGNLVARASAGSGKTLAYTLGTLDRLTARDEEAETVLRLPFSSPPPRRRSGWRWRSSPSRRRRDSP
jgi:superfamily II DNA/RNA helicase